LLYTGQRRGDVVKFGWQHLRGDVIIVRQEKTDAALEIPMLSELARALQATPRNKSDIPGDGVRQAFHTRRLWQLVS
jgi:integrase